MKKRTFTIDRVLAEIIQRPEFSSFTITSLRREYERSVAGQSSLTSSKIRKYVYKQVGRMQKIDWVVRDGEPMSRDARYLVAELPSGIVLKLLDPTIGGRVTSVPDTDLGRTSKVPPTAPADLTLPDIEAKLNTAKMEFIATLGEAETYKNLLSEHPSLREKLESRYHQSKDESSNLMGQIRALENTIKLLEPQ